MKKTIIILTVTIIILSLTIPCFAATETIYIPPLVAITENQRYSASGGGYVSANGVYAVTIPLPLDITDGVVISFTGTGTLVYTQYFLDESYNHLYPSIDISGTLSDLSFTQLQIPSGAFFVVLNIQSINTGFGVIINGETVDDVYGDHTLASRERYETIEVPDPPADVDIVNNVLEMWQRILSDNLVLINQFYDSILAPIALILGVPTIIALVGIIYHSFGGKK